MGNTHTTHYTKSDTEFAKEAERLTEVAVDSDAQKMLRLEFGSSGSLQDYRTEIVSMVEAAQRMASELEQADDRYLQAHYIAALDYFADLKKQIDTYNPQSGNQRTEPQSYWANVRRQQAEPFWSAVKEAEAAKLAISPQLNDGSILAAKAQLAEVERIKAEAEQALEAVRSSSAGTGASAYQETFSDMAGELDTEAERWDNYAIGAAVLVLLSLGVGHFLFGGDDTTGAAVQNVVSRLVLAAIPALALTVFLRNSRAARHNAVVYRTKANALATFQAFVEAADTDSTIRETITLEAARSIFSHQPSGHLRNEGETDSSSVLLEIFRSGRGS